MLFFSNEWVCLSKSWVEDQEKKYDTHIIYLSHSTFWYWYIWWHSKKDYIWLKAIACVSLCFLIKKSNPRVKYVQKIYLSKLGMKQSESFFYLNVAVNILLSIIVHSFRGRTWYVCFYRDDKSFCKGTIDIRLKQKQNWSQIYQNFQFMNELWSLYIFWYEILII